MKLARFVLVGGAGYLVDVGLTVLLKTSGWPGWSARIPAIGAAMCCTWLLNRRFTYGVRHRRTVEEAARYFTVAASMAALNYAIYLALTQWGMGAAAAVTVATACQTLISFYAYGRFVFRSAVP